MSYDRRLDGRITTVHEGAINRISSYGYTPAGRTSQIQLPNGLTRTYGYDRAQRLTSVTNVVGGTHFADFDYTLDGEGNRTNISEELWGITAPSTVDGFSLGYDGLNRLTSMVGTRGESFALDGASNIISRSGPGATYTIDGANRPTSDGTSSFTWSSTDRFTNRGADTFGYDNLDRLTQATVGGVTSVFSYDADGLLTRRAGGGITKDFLWDPASSPQRLLAAGSDRVVYGNGPLYLVRGASQDPVVFATDGQGSVRAELDQYANLTGSWRYALYGQIATANPNGSATPAVLAYTGQLLDPSGLYFLRARWYDPASARLLTRDPLDNGSQSAFAYAAGNPLSFVDPSGLKEATGNGEEGTDCTEVECPEGEVAAETGDSEQAQPKPGTEGQAKPGPEERPGEEPKAAPGAVAGAGVAVPIPAPKPPAPERPAPKPGDVKDARDGKTANKIAQLLGYEDAHDLKKGQAGGQGIISIDKKTGDVWLRKPGSWPGQWQGNIKGKRQ